MNNVAKIFLLTIINENIINEFKNILKINLNWELISILVGIILTFLYCEDIFTSFGLYPKEEIPLIVTTLITNILTGFLVGRGSNIIYKLINILDYKKDEIKQRINSF